MDGLMQLLGHGNPLDEALCTLFLSYSDPSVYVAQHSVAELLSWPHSHILKLTVSEWVNVTTYCTGGSQVHAGASWAPESPSFPKCLPAQVPDFLHLRPWKWWEHLILITWMGRDAAWATTTGDQTGSSEQTLITLWIYLERGREETFFLLLCTEKNHFDG